MRKILLLLAISASALCLKAQSKFTPAQITQDIDTLVYLIEDVEVNPYFQLDKEKFYYSVDSLKKSLTADSISMLEAYYNFSKLVSMFRQGHLSVIPPRSINRVLLKRGVPLAGIVTIKDNTRLFINTDTTIHGIGMCHGDEILSINNRAMIDYLPMALSHIAGELDSYRCHKLQSSFAAYFNMHYPNDSIYVTTLRRNNDTITVQLPAKPISATKQDKLSPYEYHAINDSVWIFNFNRCQLEGFKEFAAQMFDSINNAHGKHLIIDIRRNPGGNSLTGDEICRYISNKPFSGFSGSQAKISLTMCKFYKQKYTSDNILEYWGTEKDLTSPYPAEKRFKGKVYLLQSHHTFSSANNFAATFKQYVPGIIIGDETGGANISTGDVITANLPNTDLRIILPWKIFYEAGSKPGDEIHGNTPHISIPADNALEKALQLVTGN